MSSPMQSPSSVPTARVEKQRGTGLESPRFVKQRSGQSIDYSIRGTPTPTYSHVMKFFNRLMYGSDEKAEAQDFSVRAYAVFALGCFTLIPLFVLLGCLISDYYKDFKQNPKSPQ